MKQPLQEHPARAGGTMDHRRRFAIEAGRELRIQQMAPAFPSPHASHETGRREIARHVEYAALLRYPLGAGGKDGGSRHPFGDRSSQGGEDAPKRANRHG